MIVEKVKELRLKYSDYESYHAYHILVGSSLLNECPNFDFPGEDSIEAFLDKAEQKLSEENK